MGQTRKELGIASHERHRRNRKKLAKHPRGGQFAAGHAFSEVMRCHRCGMKFERHQRTPRRCPC